MRLAAIIIFTSVFLRPVAGDGQNNLQLGGVELFGKNDYLISTVAFTAIDASFTTFNIIRIIKSDNKKSNAMFGILFGTAQTAYGLMNYNSPAKNAGTLTTVNILSGATAISTSIIRLAKKDKAGENKVAISFFCLPAIHSQPATVVFHITKPISDRKSVMARQFY